MLYQIILDKVLEGEGKVLGTYTRYVTDPNEGRYASLRVFRVT